MISVPKSPDQSRSHATGQFETAPNVKLRTARNWISTALCVAIAVAMASAVEAAVRVGGSSLRANGQLARNFDYTGPCPVDLQFGWGVISTEATTVGYSFSRSDGGRSSKPYQTAIPRANQSVPIYERWRLGANTPQFASFTGWVELHIYFPNAVTQKAGFTIHCQ